MSNTSPWSKLRTLPATAGCIVAAVCWMSVNSPAEATEGIDYDSQIRPIFQTYCFGCHSEAEASGGLQMDDFTKLLAGGDTGLALTPGSSASSRLVLMARGALEPVMPPEGEARPDADQLQLIADWIDSGAAGPVGQPTGPVIPRVPVVDVAHHGPLPVTALAVAADGSLASGRYEQIRVLQNSAGEPQEIDLVGSKINHLDFSPDGQQLAAATGIAGAFGTIHLYDCEEHQRRELSGHRDIVFVAKFSHDGRRLATGSYDRQTIVWDVAKGEPIQTLSGHNGAIYDLCFTADDRYLITASADETLKTWDLATGERIETFGQSEGEVLTVTLSSDGARVIAGSADNRLRVWKLANYAAGRRSSSLEAVRYIDQSPLVEIVPRSDGRTVITISERGSIRIVDAKTWQIVESLPSIDGTPTAAVLAATGSDTLLVATLQGEILEVELPKATSVAEAAPRADAQPIFLDIDPIEQLTEGEASASTSGQRLPRGVAVAGRISSAGEVDRYRFSANRGEVWAIDVDADGPLDPFAAVDHSDGQPVIAARLQAVRDSYFTFRGKDSLQSDDFRMFAWQEMHLNDYLYSGGEVTRLWMHPRGPDSGFNVYPGRGSRWTYFGSSHTSHALGEPAYIVRPLPEGEPPIPNGLPVFVMPVQNDDDPARLAGVNSRIVFTAPADGEYLVRLTDTRGEGGDAYKYTARIRPAAPTFTAKIGKFAEAMRVGTGRTLELFADRHDAYDGEIVFDVRGLPDGIESTFPMTLQAEQNRTEACLWPTEKARLGPLEGEAIIVATAMINGRRVERIAGKLGDLRVEAPRKVRLAVEPVDDAKALQLAPGETITANLIVQRDEDFAKEIEFGKEFAALGVAHGVIVDNIGLNGLLVRENELQREFFITADPTSQPSRRYFWVSSNVDGGLTTIPVPIVISGGDASTGGTR